MSALVDDFVDYVARRDWVTFVEARRFFETATGVDPYGGIALEMFPNGVMWAGMSAHFVDFLDAARADGRLVLDGGDGFGYLAYLADGGALNLPIARRLPRDVAVGYAKPRWVVCFIRPRERQDAPKGA